MAFRIDDTISDTIYNQLVSYIEGEITKGNIAIGDKLLSVNMACREYGVSRDTVLAAYKVLQQRNTIKSIPGKGYFVTHKGNSNAVRVYVVFDAMNQYKETLYRSLLDALGEQFEVSIAFHYYDVELFDTLMSNAMNKFDYFVLMPHFNCDVTHILDKIPEHKLLLLDAMPAKYSRNCAAVYQSFNTDLYEGLKALLDKLRRYEALHIVYNDKFQYMPDGYVEGVYRFAGEFRYPVYVEPNFDMESIKAGHCYMAISERDLASIIKVITARKLQIGRDIGLMSFDDTPLKEVLIGGVTTLTTDFALMGRTAAQLIRDKEYRRIANPWHLYDRGSL